MSSKARTRRPWTGRHLLTHSYSRALDLSQQLPPPSDDPVIVKGLALARLLNKPGGSAFTSLGRVVKFRWPEWANRQGDSRGMAIDLQANSFVYNSWWYYEEVVDYLYQVRPASKAKGHETVSGPGCPQPWRP
jgi:hypothetical protein